MIYLLPVSHDVQFNFHHLSGELKRYLLELITEKEIDIICEEANEEVWRLSSIPLQVSADCSIDYIPCEPSKGEGEKLGILPANWQEVFAEDLAKEIVKTGLSLNALKNLDKKFAKSNAIREGFWLKKIQPHKQRNVIFILGIGHLSSNPKGAKLSKGFDKLLEANGFQVEVLSTQFVNPKFLV